MYSTCKLRIILLRYSFKHHSYIMAINRESNDRNTMLKFRYPVKAFPNAKTISDIRYFSSIQTFRSYIYVQQEIYKRKRIRISE